MLLISVIAQIPQLNLAKFFLLKSDATATDGERQLITDNINNPTLYTRQIDEDDQSIMNVPVSSQNEISPSGKY